MLGTAGALVFIAIGDVDQPAWILGYFAYLVVALLHFAVYRGPATTNASQWRGLFRRLDEAVADDELVRARQAPLGHLGMTLAPQDALRHPNLSGERRTPREVRIEQRHAARADAFRQVVDELAVRCTEPHDPRIEIRE